jgi:PAS domain-containing protein
MKDGSILWHGIILDTTERKQSEEKLQALVVELKKSQQMAHVGNWKLDLKTGTYSSSDEALHIFGFPLGSYLKIQNITDCIHPDDIERVTNRRNGLIQSNERHSLIEFRIINKESGQVKNIRSIAELQCDEENNPIAIVGTLQDISNLT